MELEHGESYQLMREIKELIDPKGLLNPGKIFL
jgi:FAD/FMN-containing dehydrogenase